MSSWHRVHSWCHRRKRGAPTEGFIHRSAWKLNSPKFTVTEFSEVGRAALFMVVTLLAHNVSSSSTCSFVKNSQAAKRPLVRRKGNALSRVVLILLAVMLLGVVLWAATDAVPVLFVAVLAGLGVLYLVLFTNL